MSGGSAAQANSTVTVVNAVVDVTVTSGGIGVEIAPSEAAQTLRQAAALSTPSGQQGQGSPSCIAGMKSSHGISDKLVELDGLVISATTGADSNSCAAAST